jgi:hypothetical protein
MINAYKCDFCGNDMPADSGISNMKKCAACRSLPYISIDKWNTVNPNIRRVFEDYVKKQGISLEEAFNSREWKSFCAGLQFAASVAIKASNDFLEKIKEEETKLSAKDIFRKEAWDFKNIALLVAVIIALGCLVGVSW